MCLIQIQIQIQIQIKALLVYLYFKGCQKRFKEHLVESTEFFLWVSSLVTAWFGL